MNARRLQETVAWFDDFLRTRNDMAAIAQRSFTIIHHHPARRMMLSVFITLSLAIPDSERPLAAESATSSTGIEVNACTLLSADEISAVVQFKVEDGVRNDSGAILSGPYSGAYSTTCLWKAAEDHGANDPRLPLGGARFVILNVMSWPTGSQQAAKFLEGFREAAEDHTIPTTPVSLTIGDDSLWWGDGVAVQKGDVSYGVSVRSVTQRSLERPMAETLASTIVKRL